MIFEASFTQAIIDMIEKLDFFGREIRRLWWVLESFVICGPFLKLGTYDAVFDAFR